MTLKLLKGGAGAIALVAAAAAAVCGQANAFELDTGDSDFKARWDNTLKYSTAYRLLSPSAALVTGENYDPTSAYYFPNTDDGDRNFKPGLISNRLDLLTELDVSYHHYGARLSGAMWYDSVYANGTNSNDSAATNNNLSVGNNQFTQATRDLMGQSSEFLDAFVYGKTSVGDKDVAWKLGKHTVLYGESMMLGGNGIAAAQAGIDVVKAVAVPNSQFKEFMRPVNQMSGQVQLTPTVTVGGYYQLDRSFDRLPAAGSYFSNVDMLGDGGESLIVANAGPAGNVYFSRGADMLAPKSGQGGLEVKFQTESVDYGLYAVQWNDHGPSGLYINPYAGAPIATPNGLNVGTYQWVYHQGIRAYGGSFSTTAGSVNIAGEASVRNNTPLASDAIVNASGTGDNNGNPLYAVGSSAHANLSWIASLGQTFLAKDTDFVGEVGWNRLLAIDKNPGALNINATRDASNIVMVLEPKYRQVMDGLDISVPMSVGYGLNGNSSVVPSFLGHQTGDSSVGVKGTYLGVWMFSANYTHYFGPSGPAIAEGHSTYLQANADRDFLSLSVSRTF